MFNTLCVVIVLMNMMSFLEAFHPACSRSILTSQNSRRVSSLSVNKDVQVSKFQLFDTIADDEKKAEFDPAAWVNPNTRGGVIVWSVILLIIPTLVYQYFVSTGMEATKVGGYVGAIFVLLSNVLWASTYIFRVANKDMTYAKQLRDYENAVLEKRLEELEDDEIDALMQEIEAEENEGRSMDF